MTTDAPAVDRPATSHAFAGAPETLVTFVPRLAPELLRRGVPSYTSIDGSMLSADISGFTALSERLAGKGKAGAEEITELVNRCFTALIEAAHEYDGEVIKFGGDALLVLFRGDAHATRAVDAGLAMHAALRASAAAKRAHLSMTVGVADGPFDTFLVGSNYRELLITGRRATEVIRLESAADKGDTLVSASIAAELPAPMLVREEAGGWVVIGSTGSTPPGPRLRDDAGDLSPFVPRAVREQLAAFAGMGGEHRLVTVGFLMVTGVEAALRDRGVDGVAADLHHLVDEVGAACDAYGVTLLHTDIATDGLKFVLCAGAPVNPGDTGDAMLRAALRIAAIDTPFELRQGVQTGRVFAGFLGSANRRTYTLMGDPVNTAARMLGKADDRDVVAVASVVAGTRTVFVSEPIEPFRVKGKSQPISAHKVRAASDIVRRDTTATPLIGRSRELEILTSAIGELGAVVELVGPAGVGKSRLVDAAWDRAEGLRIFQAACTPYGAASPYSLFRPLLRGGSGIATEASADEAGRTLTEIVTALAPGLLPMLPLLAVPFGAAVAPTPESDAIEPQFRRARIHDAVVDFLDATLDGPAFLVAEDLHWIDDASGDLLAHLVRTAAHRPWAAVLTRRPTGAWHVPAADHVRTIELQPLTDDDIRHLAIEASERPLSDAQLDVITSRSGGNPLFALELVRAVAAVDSGEVPDSIERLISARIDALPPDARRGIRIASVLGTTFRVDDALAILRAELNADAAAVDAHAELEVARQHGILEARERGRWAFFHALYRDTAYQGLPYRRRRHLHLLAARTIESRSNDPTAVAALLSLHYSEAAHYEEAWRYSLLAADVAERQNASAEAVLALQRARRAGRHRRDATRAERCAVEQRIGDLAFLLGSFAEAEAAFRRARRLSDDPITDASLMRRIGSVHERQGRAAGALRWYQRAAERIPTGDRSPGAASARARIALEEAGLRHRLGDNERCLAIARAALADAGVAADDSATALALERIHVATVYLRHPDEEHAGPRALEAHRRVGDRSGMARVLINLGIESYFASDWVAASSRYLEAAETAYAAGAVILGGTAAMNSAEILADQGQWHRALELFDDARRNFAAVGYPVGEAAALLFSAAPAMRAGLLDDAERRLTDAEDRLQRLGVSELVDDARTRSLELALLRGEDIADRAARLADELGPGHPFAIRVRRVAAIHDLDGNVPDGLERLRDCLDAPGATGLERALILAAMARFGTGHPARETWEHEASSIFAALGVVTPPPVLASDLISARTSR